MFLLIQAVDGRVKFNRIRQKVHLTDTIINEEKNNKAGIIELEKRKNGLNDARNELNKLRDQVKKLIDQAKKVNDQIRTVETKEKEYELAVKKTEQQIQHSAKITSEAMKKLGLRSDNIDDVLSERKKFIQELRELISGLDDEELVAWVRMHQDNDERTDED